MVRFIRNGTILIFFGIICSPVFWMTFGTYKIMPLQEYRNKIKVPNVNFENLFDKSRGIVNEINVWFDDNYGFRDILIRSKNQYDYVLFKTSDKVIVGREGWLFYRNFISEKIDLEKTSQNVRHDKLLELAEYLSQFDIRLIFVLVPSKSSVYPEYMPWSSPNLDKLTGYHKLSRLLKEDDGIISIDALSVLLAEKEKNQLFNKTDLHWNYIGGYHLSKVIVQKIAAKEGLKQKIWQYPFEVKLSDSWTEGGLSRLMSKFSPNMEKQEVPVNYKFNYTKQDCQKCFPKPYHYIYQSTNKDGELLPDTIVFGDSFFNEMLAAGFHHHFKKLYRTQGGGEELLEVLTSIPEGVRYFMLLSVAPYLRAKLPLFFKFPNYGIKQKRADIQIDTGFILTENWQTDSTDSEFGHGNSKYKDSFKYGVEADVSDRELTITANGASYPYVRRVIDHLQLGKKYEVKVEVSQVSSPTDVVIQIMKTDDFTTKRVLTETTSEWVELKQTFEAAFNQYYIDFVVAASTKSGSAKFRNLSVSETH
jgi:hypothetical protein